MSSWETNEPLLVMVDPYLTFNLGGRARFDNSIFEKLGFQALGIIRSTGGPG